MNKRTNIISECLEGNIYKITFNNYDFTNISPIGYKGNLKNSFSIILEVKEPNGIITTICQYIANKIDEDTSFRNKIMDELAFTNNDGSLMLEITSEHIELMEKYNIKIYDFKRG